MQTVPLFDKDGNVSSVMEMSIDMTLIHTLQHQLQASERTHKAIFDSIPNAVFLLDAAELTILDCNPASVKMYGASGKTNCSGAASSICSCPRNASSTLPSCGPSPSFPA